MNTIDISKLGQHTPLTRDPVTGWKAYYDNPILNKLANTTWHGRVFGEATMMAMLGECCDEQQFIELMEESL